MSKNKRYCCKYKAFGCGGSVFGKTRITQHEATCRFAPKDDLVGVALLARLTTLEDAVTRLIRYGKLAESKARKQATRVLRLENLVLDLQTTVKRILPNYDNIVVEFLDIPRYITSKWDNRQWSEKMIASCKYGNPKYLGNVFFQHLMETHPFFFKLKTYDTVCVNVSFGIGKGRVTGEMALRDFVINYYMSILPLIKTLWSDTETINKKPFMPEILCCGYSEKVRNRYERQKMFIHAQFARENQTQLNQTFSDLIDAEMESFREAFREKVSMVTP
jgi:hypothetical protein